jgi:hypothetical protein
MYGPVGFHSEAAAQAWLAAQGQNQNNVVDGVASRAIEGGQVEREQGQARWRCCYQSTVCVVFTSAFLLGSYAANGQPVAPILGMLSGVCLSTAVACGFIYVANM